MIEGITHWLGHESVDMTNVYVRTRRAESAPSVERNLP